MNSVALLTKLQLMETFGGVRSAIEKRAGANGAMAGTAIVGIFVFVGVAWLGYTAYGAVGAMGLDKVVFDILFLACGVLTFALSLPAILSTFSALPTSAICYRCPYRLLPLRSRRLSARWPPRTSTRF